MHPTTQSIDKLVNGGFEPSQAETIVALRDNYHYSPASFDEEYWIWRLSQVGMSEAQAQELFEFPHNPNEAFKKYQ